VLTQSSKATYEGLANRLVIVHMIGPHMYECVCVSSHWYVTLMSSLNYYYHFFVHIIEILKLAGHWFCTYWKIWSCAWGSSGALLFRWDYKLLLALLVIESVDLLSIMW